MHPGDGRATATGIHPAYPGLADDIASAAGPARSRVATLFAPASPAPRSERVQRLVRGAGIFALILGVLTVGLYSFWGRGGTLIELPWINPVALTLQALTCLTASVLVLGRYRVLQDAASYWVGASVAAAGFAGLVMSFT